MAVVGAGPAGIYAADILSKQAPGTAVDILERLPAPFGLVRYGVAPDHPRIKQIIVALHKILDRGDVRFLGNIDFGTDVTLEDLRGMYDAVIMATGAIRDADLNIPGIDLPGSYGAADFVSWYDGHPDVPRTWPLDAAQVAVVGNGNVALDVARILAKHPVDLLPTEVPDNVYEILQSSPVTDVHVFGRRGPAQSKFSPLELRELGQVPDVDVLVYAEDFELDDGSIAAIRSANQTKQVVKTLTDWTLRDPSESTASRRIHLHFLQRPIEILGADRVEGIRMARTHLVGDGNVVDTGETVDYPVQAVYRAVGYFGSPLPDVPFDPVRGVIPNEGGRVVDAEGRAIPGLYTTGWIKRGPVGLIGHTKSDALETIRNLLQDVGTTSDAGGPVSTASGAEARTTPTASAAPGPGPSTNGVRTGDFARIGHLAHAGNGSRTGDMTRMGQAKEVSESVGIVEFLSLRGVRPTTWADWLALDAYEQARGAERGRERIKVVSRRGMVAASHNLPVEVVTRA